VDSVCCSTVHQPEVINGLNQPQCRCPTAPKMLKVFTFWKSSTKKKIDDDVFRLVLVFYTAWCWLVLHEFNVTGDFLPIHDK
jgi:hypothetical protein